MNMFFIRRFILFLLLVTCLDRMLMWEVLFPNWADEVLMLLYIGLSSLVRPPLSEIKRNIIKNTLICYSILLCYGLAMGIYHGISQEAILYDIIDIFRLPIFFLLFLIVSCDKKTLEFTKRCYLILNIPSIIVGLVQWFMARFYGIYLGVSIYRDRLLGARINGLAGHNIAMGYAMMILIFILVEKIVDRRVKIWVKYPLFIMLIASTMCLIFTQSRLPIALTIIILLYKYVYFRQKVFYRKLINFASLIVILFSLFFFHSDINDYTENEESTIRYMTINIASKSINEHPLLGWGVGSYGIPESVGCSPVYDKSIISERAEDIIIQGRTREAFMFQILIELGLIGVLLYYVPFVLVSLSAIRRKNYELFLLMSLGFILQSVINGIYKMPIFIYLCILSSYGLIKKRQRYLIIGKKKYFLR